jgi:DeoR/GlpR family transcriptional regulator of sugar metabolism
MTDPTKAAQAALKWIKDGGRIYLAGGEQGEFMPSTVKQLESLGLIEKRDGRIWATPKDTQHG